MNVYLSDDDVQSSKRKCYCCYNFLILNGHCSFLRPWKWKILKEIGIPDHLTCLLRNLYAGQEATVRIGHGTTDWFQIGKGVWQGCILSPCLFNLNVEYIMEKAVAPHSSTRLENPMDGGAWWAAVHGVAKSRTRLSDFPFAFHFHALEKEMATHSSVLAWRIPGTGEPGGLPPYGDAQSRTRLKRLSSSSSS